MVFGIVVLALDWFQGQSSFDCLSTFTLLFNIREQHLKCLVWYLLIHFWFATPWYSCKLTPCLPHITFYDLAYWLSTITWQFGIRVELIKPTLIEFKTFICLLLRYTSLLRDYVWRVVLIIKCALEKILLLFQVFRWFSIYWKSIIEIHHNLLRCFHFALFLNPWKGLCSWFEPVSDRGNLVNYSIFGVFLWRIHC